MVFFILPPWTQAIPELVSEYLVLTYIYLVSSGIPIFIALNFLVSNINKVYRI